MGDRGGEGVGGAGREEEERVGGVLRWWHGRVRVGSTWRCSSVG